MNACLRLSSICALWSIVPYGSVEMALFVYDYVHVWIPCVLINEFMSILVSPYVHMEKCEYSFTLQANKCKAGHFQNPNSKIQSALAQGISLKRIGGTRWKCEACTLVSARIQSHDCVSRVWLLVLRLASTLNEVCTRARARVSYFPISLALC